MPIPELSIIIPVYNRSNLILETLDTVIRQTTTCFQCIIVDDHSTDQSYEMIREYIKNDKRFILTKRTSQLKGAPICRNEGINLAIGRYIMFLDSDDLLDPICLEQRIGYIKQSPNKNFYVFNVALYNPETFQANYLCGNLKVSNDLDGFINYTGGWNISSTVLKKSFLENNHYFDEEALSWQDVEFHIRAIIKTKKYLKYFDSQPDVYVRIHEHKRISNDNWTFQKIYQRINTISKIENLILNEVGLKYTKNFFFFYFRYLEIGARTLDHRNFSAIIQFFRLHNNVRPISEFLLIKYLKLQNFLNRNNFKFMGSLIFKVLRIIFPKQLAIPQKKIILDKTIFLKSRFSLYK